jgi:2-keto-4-pentenoate hydratase/2-oxohepta-3-ene-1,7-dioic acid hydratase in catechol pathway
MRVYSLSGEYQDFLGFEDDGTMIDLTRAIAFYEITLNNCLDEPPVDIEELIFNGRLTDNYIGEIIGCVSKYGLKNEMAAEDDYTINAPLYPGKIIALGNNYHEHIKEMNQAVPEEPILFGKWPSTVIGPDESIVKPSWIGRMDYEAELAFVVGHTAKNVDAASAMEYIAGYTCLNDVSARDIQGKDLSRKLPWMQSKNFDTFSPIGPCILLSGEVKTPVEIDVQAKVNGELKQNGNTRDYIFDIPTIIEYITKIMTLDPGDIVTTGTPVGVGPLENGDVVEITCSGVGTLSNPVVVSESE